MAAREHVNGNSHIHTNGSGNVILAEEEPTETSPLLRKDISASKGLDGSLGALADAPIENAVLNGEAGAVVEPENPMFDGLPEVMARMHWILPAVGVFLSAADQTIIVSANARIGSELNALNMTSWIASSFFLTLTSFQPLYGKLSDIFGRKPCLLFAYMIFGLGCLFCGLARTMPELIAARAFSGIGGGGMTTVVSIMMSDIIPLKKRGMWQGYINVIYATGASVGAPLGGFLVDTIGWRWAFILQAPICLVAFITVYFLLELPQKASAHWRTKLSQIDFLGALSLVIAVLSLLLGIDYGANNSWSSLFTIITLSLSPPLLAFFLFVESKIASHPFAPARTILPRPLLSCYLVNFCAFAAYIGLLFYVPLYYQVVDGVSATQAGFRLIPSIVGSVSGSLLGGRYMQNTGKYYWITIWAYIMSLFGNTILLLSSGIIPNVHFTTGMIVGLTFCGFGGGIGVTTTLIALISNADPKDQAIATACSYLFRSLGSVIGVSISATVVQQILRLRLREKLGVGEEADHIFEMVRHSIENIRELPLKDREIVKACYQVATSSAFSVTILLYLGALVNACFIREKKLSR